MNHLEKESLSFAKEYTSLLTGLDKCVIFITGANGLIGKTLINLLLAYNQHFKANIKIIAGVRSANKFSLTDKNIKLHLYDLNKPLKYRGKVDYIVHCAALTSSASFVNKAVDVLTSTFLGAKHILDFAEKKKVKGIILLSSMEIYGLGKEKEALKEDDFGAFSSLLIRNSYPESKRYLEALAKAYFLQKDIPLFIARLAQCFGPGVKKDDERFFAAFAQHLLKKEDFTLFTDGKSKRCYIYTFDAAIALLTILLKGKVGEVYNVANESTYISIKDLCLEMIQKFNSPIKLLIKKDDKQNFKYLPKHNLLLDTTKLKALGYSPSTNLYKMFSSLLMSWLELRN